MMSAINFIFNDLLGTVRQSLSMVGRGIDQPLYTSKCQIPSRLKELHPNPVTPTPSGAQKSGGTMFQQYSFTHHGFIFRLEAEGWTNENSARTAMSALRRWTLHHDPAETTQLFVALIQEGEAIAHERDFDHETEVLRAVRAARKCAVDVARQTGRIQVNTPVPVIEADRVAEQSGIAALPYRYLKSNLPKTSVSISDRIHRA